MNINEIAKMAGVSASAVSRYLNQGYLSEEKKKRIAEVIEQIQGIVEGANEVNRACEIQAEAAMEVNTGVEQISMSVQNISATAEESSATSQELFAQSETLNSLVNQFTLQN